MRADKISPLLIYAKGRGKGKKRLPDIQKYWLPIHTQNFEAIKELIVGYTKRWLPSKKLLCARSKENSQMVNL